MSIHRSLKTKSGSLNQHRNVLNRAERMSALAAVDKFNMDADSPLGLPKVRSIKAAVAKKPKKAEAEGADGAAAAPAAAGKAPAGGGKAAAAAPAGKAAPAGGAAKGKK